MTLSAMSYDWDCREVILKAIKRSLNIMRFTDDFMAV